MKMQIKTTPEGKVQVIELERGEDITKELSRIDIFITTRGKVSASLEFANIDLNLLLYGEKEEN